MVPTIAHYCPLLPTTARCCPLVSAETRGVGQRRIGSAACPAARTWPARGRARGESTTGNQLHSTDLTDFLCTPPFSTTDAGTLRAAARADVCLLLVPRGLLSSGCRRWELLTTRDARLTTRASQRGGHRLTSLDTHHPPSANPQAPASAAVQGPSPKAS